MPRKTMLPAGKTGTCAASDGAVAAASTSGASDGKSRSVCVGASRVTAPFAVEMFSFLPRSLPSKTFTTPA
jgi:hypothetical protein